MTTEKLHHETEHHADPQADLHTEFHDMLAERRPGALRLLNGAVDAGSDHTKAAWLNPGTEAQGLTEAREIVRALREFTEGRPLRERSDAASAVADVMSLPLSRAVARFGADLEQHGEAGHPGEPMAAAEVVLSDTVRQQSYAVRFELMENPGDSWEKPLAELRDVAHDLEIMNSGGRDPHHFSRALTGVDPRLSAEIHTAADTERTAGQWPSWVEGNRNAEGAQAVFDTFQEAVQGTSQAYRDEAAFDIAHAMSAQLGRAVQETGQTAITGSHAERESALQETLARGDREEFLENVRQMGRTARMVDRYEKYGTENPTAAQAAEFREARSTEEKRALVFNGYLAGRDPELAREVRENGWPALGLEQAQMVFDTFQENWPRLQDDGAALRSAVEVARAIGHVDPMETAMAFMSPGEEQEADRTGREAVRGMAAGLRRNDPERYRQGLDRLEEMRDMMHPLRTEP